MHIWSLQQCVLQCVVIFYIFDSLITRNANDPIQDLLDPSYNLQSVEPLNLEMIQVSTIYMQNLDLILLQMHTPMHLIKSFILMNISQYMMNALSPHAWVPNSLMQILYYSNNSSHPFLDTDKNKTKLRTRAFALICLKHQPRGAVALTQYCS